MPEEMGVQLQPLSKTDYHDWHLEGIELPPAAVRLCLRKDDRGAIVELGQVIFFVATDLMKGNIVLELASLRISSHNIAWILDDLLSFNSQYFTKSEYEHFHSSADIFGKIYIIVTCSYGVRVGAICESVKEIFEPN